MLCVGEISNVAPKVRRALRSFKISVGGLGRLVAENCLNRIYRENRRLSRFDHVDYKNAVQDTFTLQPTTARNVNFVQEEFHDAKEDHDDNGIEPTPSSDEDNGNNSSENQLLAYLAGRTDADIDPTDIRNVLSTSVPRKTNVHKVTYHVSEHKIKRREGTLCDRGATGGVLGEDLRVLEYTQSTCSVIGVDHHEVP